ncbi:hypothetical protein [Paenibacillus polymyxa]|uniref:Uncharacterized protein n=1 Tax=Paenibacillus polymyxa TaxID=1406 RepID=A0AAE9L8C8_PAEPO|nr:hypothetical protein [Paenibacillus polymyxa]URJ50715.1 hypothetical protein MF626_000081 [Paenibacillus polymyxa]
MAQSFAYLDNVGILHLHPLESEAAKHGKYAATNLGYDESGFPVIEGEGTVYYSDQDKAYIKGNEHNGQLIATPSILKQLITELK